MHNQRQQHLPAAQTQDAAQHLIYSLDSSRRDDLLFFVREIEWSQNKRTNAVKLIYTIFDDDDGMETKYDDDEA